MHFRELKSEYWQEDVSREPVDYHKCIIYWFITKRELIECSYLLWIAASFTQLLCRNPWNLYILLLLLKVDRCIAMMKIRINKSKLCAHIRLQLTDLHLHFCLILLHYEFFADKWQIFRDGIKKIVGIFFAILMHLKSFINHNKSLFDMKKGDYFYSWLL